MRERGTVRGDSSRETVREDTVARKGGGQVVRLSYDRRVGDISDCALDVLRS